MSLVLLVWKSLHFLTWMSVSFHRFGKFSAIISSNKFSISFSLFSKILKMHILVCLMLSQRSLKPFSLKKQKQKLFLFDPWVGNAPEGGHGNPLQCSCLENPHGQRGLAGCRPWGLAESDTAGWLSAAQRRQCYRRPQCLNGGHWYFLTKVSGQGLFSLSMFWTWLCKDELRKWGLLGKLPARPVAAVLWSWSFWAAADMSAFSSGCKAAGFHGYPDCEVVGFHNYHGDRRAGWE